MVEGEGTRAVRPDVVADCLRIHGAVGDEDVVIGAQIRLSGLTVNGSGERAAFAVEHGSAGQTIGFVIDRVVINDRRRDTPKHRDPPGQLFAVPFADVIAHLGVVGDTARIAIMDRVGQQEEAFALIVVRPVVLNHAIFRTEVQVKAAAVARPIASEGRHVVVGFTKLNRGIERVPRPAPDAGVPEAAVVGAIVAVEQAILHWAYHRAVTAIVVQVRVEHLDVFRRINSSLVVGAGHLDAGLVVVPRFHFGYHHVLNVAKHPGVELIEAAADVDAVPTSIVNLEVFQPDVAGCAGVTAGLDSGRPPEPQDVHNGPHVLVGPLIAIIRAVKTEGLWRLPGLGQVQIPNGPVLNVLQKDRRLVIADPIDLGQSASPIVGESDRRSDRAVALRLEARFTPDAAALKQDAVTG